MSFALNWINFYRARKNIWLLLQGAYRIPSTCCLQTNNNKSWTDNIWDSSWWRGRRKWKELSPGWMMRWSREIISKRRRSICTQHHLYILFVRLLYLFTRGDMMECHATTQERRKRWRGCRWGWYSKDLFRRTPSSLTLFKRRTEICAAIIISSFSPPLSLFTLQGASNIIHNPFLSFFCPGSIREASCLCCAALKAPRGRWWWCSHHIPLRTRGSTGVEEDRGYL